MLSKNRIDSPQYDDETRLVGDIAFQDYIAQLYFIQGVSLDEIANEYGLSNDEILLIVDNVFGLEGA